MPIPEHSHELIQKYLDALASELEIAELEQLLATDSEVAQAFAEMARLDANLQRFFEKQYKMDQVAALLNAPAPLPTPPIDLPTPPPSTFTPRYADPFPSRRGLFAGRLAVIRSKKFIAIAVLLVVTGVALWTARDTGAGRPRLVSGHVAVGGRKVTRIPENGAFEVTGRDAAVIELPGGARIKLAAATRVAIGREKDQFVVKLSSGGGDFDLQPGQPSFRVETELGVVKTDGGRFSLELVTTLPAHVSPTIAFPLPRLVVVVAQGSVTVKHEGMTTTLSAGEEHIFLNSIST